MMKDEENDYFLVMPEGIFFKIKKTPTTKYVFGKCIGVSRLLKSTASDSDGDNNTTHNVCYARIAPTFCMEWKNLF